MPSWHGNSCSIRPFPSRPFDSPARTPRGPNNCFFSLFAGSNDAMDQTTSCLRCNAFPFARCYHARFCDNARVCDNAPSRPQSLKRISDSRSALHAHLSTTRWHPLICYGTTAIMLVRNFCASLLLHGTTAGMSFRNFARHYCSTAS